MAEPVDPELVEVIRRICRKEVQGELQALRADVNRLKRKLSDVQTDDNTRQCGLPWECFEERQERWLPTEDSRLSEDVNGGGASLVGRDLEHLTVEISDPFADIEAAKHDYRQIVRDASDAKQESQLNCDVWGATIFVIVKDFPDMFEGKASCGHWLRAFVILSSMVLNLFLQFMFLYWAAVLLMLPNVKEVQDTYRSFHIVAFNSGTFDTKGFQSFEQDELDKICGMGMASNLFLFACLFVWVARCFNEMRLIYQRKLSLDSLPELPSGVCTQHMVHESSMQIGDFLQEPKYMIVCLNATTRIMLDLLIVLPKTLISILLLLIGMGFLTSSQSFTDLILNSLAMDFILDVDELIFDAFLPFHIKGILKNAKIITPLDEDRRRLSAQELDDAQSKRNYVMSIFYFLCVFGFIVVWLNFQPIIPGYEHDIPHHCTGYRESLRDVSCKFWQRDCFPK